MEQQTQILAVMAAYLALLILWGLYQGRKVKTGADYAIAAGITAVVATLVWPNTQHSAEGES